MALLQSGEAKEFQLGLKVWTASFLVLETKPHCGLQSKGKQCEGTGNTSELREPHAEVTKVIPKPPTKQPSPELHSLNFT